MSGSAPRMPAETPADRDRRVVRRPHRLDRAGPPARARHQPLRGPGSPRPTDGWLERLGVVKMDPLAPTPTPGRSGASTPWLRRAGRSRTPPSPPTLAELSTTWAGRRRAADLRCRPRHRPLAFERGRLGAVIAGGMRRSEVSALGRRRRRGRQPTGCSSSPSDAGKTNQEGETRDVRFMKGSVARGLRGPAGRLEPGGPEDRVVPLSNEDGGATVQCCLLHWRRSSTVRCCHSNRGCVRFRDGWYIN